VRSSETTQVISSNQIAAGVIVNSDINASAAIAWSKIATTGAIVNADVNATAAIAYSKLNLADSIVNADINASAAIAYSKLNLAGAIVNADISTNAAIAASKLDLSGATFVNPKLRISNRQLWTAFLGTRSDSTAGSGAITAFAQALQYDTGATGSSRARSDWINSAVEFDFKRGNSWEINFYIDLDDITSVELEVGLRNSSTTALLSSAESGTSFIVDTSASANWRCKSANGTTLGDSDSGVAVAAGRHVLSMVNDETSIFYYLDNTLVATRTTVLPATGTGTYPWIIILNEAAAAKQCYLMGFTGIVDMA
jgi:hypothetical protein